MVRPKLTVHRKGYVKKGYKRKAYVRKGGIKVKAATVKKTKVPPTTFKIKDVGARGRGKKVILIKNKGALRNLGYSLNKPANIRHKALSKAVEKYGAARVWRRLHAQVQLREEAGVPGAKPRANVRKAWIKFRNDRDWVKKTFKPKLTPSKAIKKWKSMSHAQRVRARM